MDLKNRGSKCINGTPDVPKVKSKAPGVFLELYLVINNKKNKMKMAMHAGAKPTSCTKKWLLRTNKTGE